MNIYVKAGLRTLLMLGSSFLAVYLIILAVKYIDPEMLGYIGLGLMVGALAYLAFSFNLNQLRYQEQLQKLDESIKNVKVDK